MCCVLSFIFTLLSQFLGLTINSNMISLLIFASFDSTRHGCCYASDHSWDLFNRPQLPCVHCFYLSDSCEREWFQNVVAAEWPWSCNYAQFVCQYVQSGTWTDVSDWFHVVLNEEWINKYNSERISFLFLTNDPFLFLNCFRAYESVESKD